MLRRMGQAARRLSANFDVLRLCAASAVLVSHAVLVTKGGTWWTAHATGPFVQIGNDAVAVFFVISGILVTQSWRGDPSMRRYLARRALRLMPALLVTVALSAFVVGTIVSQLTAASYLRTPGTWAYLLNGTLFLQPYQLPGVFTHIPDAGTVNGSLWTLRYEFLCYLLVPLVVALVTVTRRRVVVLALTVATTVIATATLTSHTGPFLDGIPWSFAGLPGAVGWDVVPLFMLLSYFLAGMCIQIWVPKVRLDGRLAALAVVVFIVFSQHPRLFPVSVVALAYAVGYLGLAARPFAQRLVALGDASYGIYVWGFVVEQLVVNAFGSRISAIGVFAIAMPVTWAIGILSWRLIEKPALRFKPRAPIRQDVRPRRAAVGAPDRDSLVAFPWLNTR